MLWNVDGREVDGSLMMTKIVLDILVFFACVRELEEEVGNVYALFVGDCVKTELLAEDVEGLNYGEFCRLHVFEDVQHLLTGFIAVEESCEILVLIEGELESSDN
jgi:hypothetical protein